MCEPKCPVDNEDNGNSVRLNGLCSKIHQRYGETFFYQNHYRTSLEETEWQPIGADARNSAITQQELTTRYK